MPGYSDFLDAGTVINTSRAEVLGSTQSSISAISDTLLISHVDWINKDFFQSAYTDFGTQGWSWLQTDCIINTIQDISITVAVNTSSTQITVDTNVDPNGGSGTLYIRLPDGGFDIISYSAYAANVFTIDTTKHKPSYSHLVGAKVGFMYKLPVDFGRILSVYVNDAYNLVESKSASFPPSGSYKIWEGSLLFSEDFGVNNILIEYQKSPVTITTLADKLIIPSQYRRYPIEKLNAFIYARRLKRQDAQIAEANAMMHLQRAFGYDINDDADDAVYAEF